MLTTLIRAFLHNRPLVLLLTALIIAVGIFAYEEIPIDAFPDVSNTQVKIILKAPGMTPEEVETRVIIPIETELLGIPHETNMRSTAKYAVADITLDFTDETDIYWARQQVTERLSGVIPSLPSDVMGGLAPITTPQGEVFMFTIEGDTLSLEGKRTLLERVIRPQLRTLPGIADVNSLGGYVRSFEIVPNHAALLARHLSTLDLMKALEQNNRNDGAGRIEEGEEALLVRIPGMATGLDDLRNIIVTHDGTSSITRVGDVATVQLGALTRYGAVTKDGKEETVEALVLSLRGANARKLVESVRDKLATMEAILPKGITTKVFYDRGSLVERASSTVFKALLEAIILVVVLLLVFLGNIRAALVVAITLPLCALITFLVMWQTGMSANLMSLGGLAIAIGMLVDAALVVVENMVVHMAHDVEQPGLQSKLAMLLHATTEVITPVIAGVAIIMLVFFPLLTLEGLEGKLFKPVALTIVYALGASLLVAFSVIPVCASLLLRQASHEDPKIVQWLQKHYETSLRWSMHHPKHLALIALLACALAVLGYARLGKSFMPTMDEGDIIIQMTGLPSMNMQQSVDLNMRIEKAIIDNVPEVASVVARNGSDEIGLDTMGANETDLFMTFKPQATWRQPGKEWLTDQLRAVMSNFPGLSLSFTQPIDSRVSEMLTGVRGDLAVKLFGTDIDTLNTLSEQIAGVLNTLAGHEDVLVVKNSGVQYFSVEVDRLAAGRYGLNVNDIQDMLRIELEGKVTGYMLEAGRRVPVLMRGAEGIRMSAERFAEQRITLANGQSIALADIAHFERKDGPVKVGRENGERFIVVQSNVRDRDLVGFVDEAKQAVAQQIKLPHGYRLVWGGQFENQQRAAKRLALVVPVSLALIFFLLYLTFGSAKLALLILSNIPFALVGGIVALWLSGEYLSVPASVGLIALLGIAVLNGVVMISYFQQLARQGIAASNIPMMGALRRLRPVLMTASITAFGLLPLLLASGPGSEIQRPLAIVVMGGLFTATPLTLYFLPILYQRLINR
ncbi:efflux RND transporter permease subunit [Ampullimonas aquatilis]|uniref:efflux RND transporter permease subunit n=1 Tax=Ampullimonas aquatilis TaxID=1341549 RepID=UPI003C70F3BD